MLNTGMEGSAAFAGLTEDENRLAGEIEAWLIETNPVDCKLVQERFAHLRTLGAAVFGYPSIRNTQFLRGILRDEEHLTESVFAFSSYSHLLYTPTKVVALRSFLVAKFHAFSLLFYLSGGKDDFQASVRTVLFSIISTLMAEAVYFSFLDDSVFAKDTKSSLADDLIALWDSGVDLRGIRHLSALSSLWLARDAVPPIFGTMDGNAELLRVSIEMDSDWQEFLVNETSNDQTRWALEEFLFGLSWEEIQHIRSRLADSGVTAVSYDEGRSYLNSEPSYSMANNRDPRALYNFFIERRDACTFRKRTNAPGPRHTLEEIYLKYRIIKEIR